MIYPGVWISPPTGLVVGDEVDLARGVIITSGGGVEIGDRTLIGYRTMILSSNHVVGARETRIFGSGHEKRRVVIGADAWVGAGVVVLPGVTIGHGAVVGGGSVVAKSIPDFAIAAGNPAKVLKFRGGGTCVEE